MYNWFTCKMTFDRQGEDGLIKKVTEQFLVDRRTVRRVLKGERRSYKKLTFKYI